MKIRLAGVSLTCERPTALAERSIVGSTAWRVLVGAREVGLQQERLSLALQKLEGLLAGGRRDQEYSVHHGTSTSLLESGCAA